MKSRISRFFAPSVTAVRATKTKQTFATNLVEQDKNCLFCTGLEGRVISENGNVFAVRDKYPVTENHMLIIPRRHTTDYFSMTGQERRNAEELIQVLRNKIANEDDTVTGFNVGMNCGESAGQTINHAHIHLIPRRDGDAKAPRGGVRGVIPDKMSY